MGTPWYLGWGPRLVADSPGVLQLDILTSPHRLGRGGAAGGEEQEVRGRA